MDETTRNTLGLCLKEWGESSVLFRDPARWLEGLKAELNEIPELEEETKSLRLKIDVSIQSLLLDMNFNADEVFELMRMPATAIDIIDSDGDLEKWKEKRRKQRSQPSSPRIS